MKIHKDVIELRKLVGGIKAVKGGASFPVKSAKELVIKLRAAADKLNMVMAGAIIESDVRTSRVKTPKGDEAEIVTVIHTVQFMSDDGSSLVFVGVGQGGDSQDKAAGKASTYAWKDAVLKGLCIPDADMIDSDDEEFPLGKPEKTTNAPPLREVLDAISSATDRASATSKVKEIMSKHKNWTPAERNQIGNALTSKV